MRPRRQSQGGQTGTISAGTQMDDTGEMLLLGAGLIAAGAIIAFLVWTPRIEEGDPHYGDLRAHIGKQRIVLIGCGFLVAAIGLVVLLRELYRLAAGLAWFS